MDAPRPLDWVLDSQRRDVGHLVDGGKGKTQVQHQVALVQLAHAASIIANRGLIKTPKINKNIIYDKNENVIKKEEFLRNNINQENWDRITEAMFNVVNKKNGTAYWVTKNKSNKISGKTGTVQVYALSQDTDIREKDNIPDHLKDHSLYIGFAPKNDPEVVVATVIENIGSGRVRKKRQFLFLCL